ncbi:hypothetical protein L0M14_16345 [Paenibacillus hexagrammi]|uniref:Uncharacterized protein n=1 Tax=Paenibacillus hexagrammi TaxID=2908839 RepID=A0ABY3SE42_9BACL|nr:hypothetical protein [Paenibacillus sp. YPD9-1]UJF31401.1 hypothetical protein L0M14_16345 [Paenibacillus sp. YPD9-1]
MAVRPCGVLVDDDGSGYIYFGGGVPTGKDADLGTARVAKLGADMTSLDLTATGGSVKPINPPWLFEDSGINKYNGKYYYLLLHQFSQEDIRRIYLRERLPTWSATTSLGPFTFEKDDPAEPCYFLRRRR